MATNRKLPGAVPKQRKYMKPSCIRNLLSLGAIGALALLAGMTARADYPSTVLGDSPLTYHRFSETTVVPTPYPLATNLGTLGTVANGSDAVAQDPGVVRGVAGALADPNNTAYNFPGGTNTAVAIPYNAVLAQAALPRHLPLCLGHPHGLHRL